MAPPTHFHDDDVIAFGDSIFKISKFRDAVQKCFGHDVGYGLMALLESQGIKIDRSAINPDGDQSTFGDWFGDGIPCELLKTDADGWHQAKARIRIEIELEMERPVAPQSPQPLTAPALPQAPPPMPDLSIDEQDATLHTDVWSDHSAAS